MVPMKTRKRFRAHHSIHWEITSHPSRGIHAHLLGRDELAILFCQDGDLPGSAALKLSRTFIQAVAFVAKTYGRTHCCHSHCRHRRHEKRHADFRPGDGCSISVCDFHAVYVAAFVWRARIRTLFDFCFGGLAWSRLAFARSRWGEGTGRALKAALR